MSINGDTGASLRQSLLPLPMSPSYRASRSNEQDENNVQMQTRVSGKGGDGGEGGDDSDDSEGSNDGGGGPPPQWSLKSEVGSILQVSIPVSLATISRLLIFFTDVAFIGRLGTVCLSAGSLALNIAYIIQDVTKAVAMSLNALGAQAHGTGNLKLVGQWLQLTLVAVTFLCLLLSVPYFFTDKLVELVTNDTYEAQLSLEFNVLSSFLLWPAMVYLAVRQAFQSVGVVMPALVISILGVLLNIGFNQFFIHGFVPDSWSNSCSIESSIPAGNDSDQINLQLTDLAFVGMSNQLGSRAAAFGRLLQTQTSRPSSSGAYAASRLDTNDDANRTWPWPTGQHSFPIKYEDGVFAGFGFAGSPLSTTTSLLLQAAMFYVFCFHIKKYHNIFWGGWSRESFSKFRIGIFIKVAVPMAIGYCVEDWGVQLLSFVSGELGPLEVATISIQFNIWGVLWAFYWGWGLGLQIRLGRHIGSGKIDRAQGTVKVSAIMCGVIGATLGLLCFLLRDYLPQIFTSSQPLIQNTSGTMYLLSISYFLGCTNLCGSSVLEGMSRNTETAIINFIGTWGVMVPVSWYFMLGCPFFSNKPVVGFWVGTIIADTLKCVALWATVLTTDWKKQVERATKRQQ